MDMGSIAQTLKQLSDSFHIMSDRFDRNDSTMQSIHKTLIQINERVDRQEATVRALQANVFGPERGPVVEICAGFSFGAKQKYPHEDSTANTWGDIGDTRVHVNGDNAK